MSNARFSDYATSGAFQIGLTRNQVAQLGLIASGEYPRAVWGALASLYRKGLIEPIRAEPDVMAGPAEEYRLTEAGVLVAALCAQAGLTNVTPGLGEIDALRAQLDATREKLRAAYLDNRSLRARLELAEDDLDAARRVAACDRPRIQVRLRDPQPDRPVEAMFEEGAE